MALTKVSSGMLNNGGGDITTNNAIGTGALNSNTTGANNTAVGYQAGYSNTTGVDGVYIGRGAGYSNLTGDGNTFVGRDSGRSATGGWNTIYGAYSGYVLTTGTGNTFLGTAGSGAGSGCGGLITTGSKNTVIGGFNGNQGGLDIRTASNQVVLSDGDGNIKGRYDASGLYYQSTNSGYYGVMIVNNTSNLSGSGVFQSILGANANNTNSYHFIAGTGVPDVFYVYGNGNVVNKNNSYGTLSDIKLKENIVDATPKLDKVLQLKVRNFNLKTEPNQKQIGFIAQEFEQVFPSMVDESFDRDEEGNVLDTVTKSIKTSVLTPILIKAIQELNAKVDAQAAEIAALKGA